MKTFNAWIICSGRTPIPGTLRDTRRGCLDSFVRYRLMTWAKHKKCGYRVQRVSVAARKQETRT